MLALIIFIYKTKWMSNFRWLFIVFGVGNYQYRKEREKEGEEGISPEIS